MSSLAPAISFRAADPPPPTRGLALGVLVCADSLLPRLDFPRDGTAGLERGREILTEALRGAGIAPLPGHFAAHPERAWLAGLAFLASGLCALGGGLGRNPRGRAWRPTLGPSALLSAALGLLALHGAFDPLLPPTQQVNVSAVIEPRGAVRQEILLVAHYDSKTEWLDHLSRGALAGAVALVAGAALACAAIENRATRAARRASPRPPGRRRWLLPVLAAAAGIGSILLGANFLSGRFLRERSHGIVDDGAACALLVELASASRIQPPTGTRLHFLWSAAEEIGGQGSAAAVRAAAGRMPEAVLNLECLGAGSTLGVAGMEWTGRGLARSDGGLAQALAAAAPCRLQRLLIPIVSDAGPWRRGRVRAITLLGIGSHGLPARGLHGPQDRLAGLDPAALDRVRRTVRAFLSACDSLPATP